LVIRAATAKLKRELPRFIRFGVVGGFGLLVDIAVVYGLRRHIGLYYAGLISYFIAASANWGLHRIWTFKGHRKGSALKQWLMFLAANSLGFAMNRGVFFAMAASFATVHRHPIIGIAAGTITGLFANFYLSHRVVFKVDHPR